MAGDRLSRRDVLGGLVSAAAVGVAVRGTALASPAAADPRSAGMLRLGSNENSAGLGPAARPRSTPRRRRRTAIRAACIRRWSTRSPAATRSIDRGSTSRRARARC